MYVPFSVVVVCTYLVQVNRWENNGSGKGGKQGGIKSVSHSVTL